MTTRTSGKHVKLGQSRGVYVCRMCLHSFDSWLERKRHMKSCSPIALTGYEKSHSEKVPATAVGLILGAGGSNVKAIIKDSGVVNIHVRSAISVDVNEDSRLNVSEELRRLEIYGVSEAIDKAVKSIQALIQKAARRFFCHYCSKCLRSETELHAHEGRCLPLAIKSQSTVAGTSRPSSASAHDSMRDSRHRISRGRREIDYLAEHNLNRSQHRLSVVVKIAYHPLRVDVMEIESNRCSGFTLRVEQVASFNQKVFLAKVQERLSLPERLSMRSITRSPCSSAPLGKWIHQH